MPSPTRPNVDEYAEFYAGYVARVPDGDLVEILKQQQQEFTKRLAGLTTEQLQYRPTPADWNVLEVLGHIIDGEQVFAYRALRIARGDTTPLMGFDQDDFVRAAQDSQRPLNELLTLYNAIRSVSILRFSSFSTEAWQQRGVVSGYPCSARAWAYITAGHELHHIADFTERYRI